MRVFVLEYVTGGGCAGAPLPAALAREGTLMREALVRDLLALGEVEVLVALDARLPCPREHPRLHILRVAADETPWLQWARAVEEADIFWPVAPETGGVLERLARLGTARGTRLALSEPDTLACTASKRATLAALARAAIPHVPAFPCRPPYPSSPAGYVVKPDDGAGAEGVRFIAEKEALPADEGLILQPYVRGEPFSLSLLVRSREVRLLSCNAQDTRLAAGEFHYCGWTVGGAEHHRAAALPLATAIARCFPGLFGYVGVDLIAAEGREPLVLEINPRLTTPYAVLSRALGVNVAGLVLDALAGRPWPAFFPPPLPTSLFLDDFSLDERNGEETSPSLARSGLGEGGKG